LKGKTARVLPCLPLNYSGRQLEGGFSLLDCNIQRESASLSWWWKPWSSKRKENDDEEEMNKEIGLKC
jgi:hypothetical protein